MPGSAADTTPPNPSPTPSEQRLAVERALDELNTLSPRTARILDLHYCKHLSLRRIAVALNLPPAVVVRELRFAKAWLRARLKR